MGVCKSGWYSCTIACFRESFSSYTFRKRWKKCSSSSFIIKWCFSNCSNSAFCETNELVKQENITCLCCSNCFRFSYMYTSNWLLALRHSNSFRSFHSFSCCRLSSLRFSHCAMASWSDATAVLDDESPRLRIRKEPWGRNDFRCCLRWWAWIFEELTSLLSVALFPSLLWTLFSVSQNQSGGPIVESLYKEKLSYFCFFYSHLLQFRAELKIVLQQLLFLCIVMQFQILLGFSVIAWDCKV